MLCAHVISFTKNRGHNHSRSVKYTILSVYNTTLFCSHDHNASRVNETIYVENIFIEEQTLIVIAKVLFYTTVVSYLRYNYGFIQKRRTDHT